MAIQMYLVQPTGDSDEDARASIAEFIAGRGGYVLMATSSGSLIVAFDEDHLPAVKQLAQVAFVGGVTMDPNGPKAALLQRIFAENVALQLNSRPAATTSPIPPPFSANRLEWLPADQAPLRWPVVPSGEGGGLEDL